MPDDTLHPDDAAAMREPLAHGRGELCQQLSNAVVALYFAALISLGVATLRKGHTVLFVVGIIFPFLWIIGALMAPTPRAASLA
jgi:hypothetical protein